jgi:hypothetical protein
VLSHSSLLLVEEIYNAEFISPSGKAFDYPETSWFLDVMNDGPDSLIFRNHDLVVTVALPDKEIQCELCQADLKWEFRLNEEIRYCPQCDDKQAVIKAYGKNIFAPYCNDDDVPF